MCNMRDPCTSIHVCAHAKKDAKPRVEKKLDKSDMTTMSLSFIPKLPSTVDRIFSI